MKRLSISWLLLPLLLLSIQPRIDAQPDELPQPAGALPAIENVNKPKLTLQMRSHAQIACVAFSPDSDTIAAAGVAGDELTADLWVAGTGVPLKTIDLGQAPGRSQPLIRFSHDGKILASSSGGASFYLSSVAEGKIVWGHVWLARVPLNAQTGESVTSIDFSNDDKLLLVTVSSARSRVRVYNLETHEELAGLYPNTSHAGANSDPIPSAISPDGALFATGGEKLQVWSLAAPKPKPVTKDEVKRFTRDFLTVLERPNINLIDTFKATGELQPNDYFRNVIRKMTEQLAVGTTMSSIFSLYPDIFDDNYVATVRVGESSRDIDPFTALKLLQ